MTLSYRCIYLFLDLQPTVDNLDLDLKCHDLYFMTLYL